VRFFRQIKSGIDVEPLLDEIRANEGAWLQNTSRQDKVSAQRDTNTIFLRTAAKRWDVETRENQEVRSTIMSKAFPKAVAFMESFAEEMGGSLERSTIVRLKPHSIVERHIDAGSYYFLRDRFHLVLFSAQGSVLASGDEEVRMWPGELWWFDNKQHHWAKNDGAEWRIHYIFDVLSAGLEHLAVNPISVPDRVPYEIASPEVEVAHPSVSDSSTRGRLLEAIASDAILRSENQALVAPSGRANTWLIDMRRVLTNAQLLDAAADLFWELIGPDEPFQVGGMETASIPLVAAILVKSVARGKPINGFIVRKERKTHGAGNTIEGRLTDEPIIIVDDILNSGQSMEKTRAILEAYGRDIAQVFVLIDYQSGRGLAWLGDNGLKAKALFTLRDLGLSIAPKDDIVLPPIFRKVWSFASDKPSFFHRVSKSFPATDGKRVYFGSDNGTFWALDAARGSIAWQFKVHTDGKKNIWSAPAVHDGFVYFGAYDGNVYCLESDSGAEVWRFTEADFVGSSPALAPDLGLLFIGLEFAVPGKQGAIVALDLRSGSKAWEHSTRRFTHASPAYWPDRRLVACGSNDDELFLFEALSGRLHWRFQTRGEGRKGSIRHAPAFDIKRGHVIAGAADGYIYVVDVATGMEVWSVRTDNDIYTVPLCVDDVAFVGSTDKYLYVLDLEQRCVRKKIAAHSKIYGPPRLLNHSVYFGACNGLLYKIDKSSADVLGTYQLPDSVTNALTFSPETNLFYALTYVNELYALAPV
jgi:orotate phosphoribosyltransferase